MHLLEKSKPNPAYIAILGMGGIGKTTLGVSFLHHPSVVLQFGIFRWFISCKDLLNAEALRSSIAAAFKLAEKSLIPSLKRLATRIDSQMMLVLDNLDTTWEPKGNKKAVEELLLHLTDVPGLSLVVTLRGPHRPFGIPWTRPVLPPLQALDYDASIQTFISISDVNEDTPGLRELIQLMDGLPLAITLMAHQAQHMSCALLLRRWNNARIAMLNREAENELSSEGSPYIYH